jgi:hypothetical protein
MPSRRRFLAVLGSTGLTGCVGGPESAVTGTDSTSTSTDTGTGTTTTTQTPDRSAVGDTITADGAALTLVEVVTASGLPFVYTDSGGVQSSEGRRYVLADIATRGSSPPAASRYSLTAGARLVGPAEPRGSYWFGLDEHRYPYSPGPGGGTDSGGWLAFPVEGELDADAPQITVNGAGWRLPESVTERLRQPAPQFDLVSFDYPETVGSEEPFDVSVTAANTGRVAGTFCGVLNASIKYASYAYPFWLDLDPGEEATWSKAYGGGEGVNEPGDTGSLDLRTMVGERDGEIEVTTATDQER